MILRGVYMNIIQVTIAEIVSLTNNFCHSERSEESNRYAKKHKVELNYCADITLISYLRQLLTGIVPSLNAPEP